MRLELILRVDERSCAVDVLLADDPLMRPRHMTGQIDAIDTAATHSLRHLLAYVRAHWADLDRPCGRRWLDEKIGETAEKI